MHSPGKHSATAGATVPNYSDRADVDALALAYRAGHGDLGALYRAVESTFRGVLTWTIRRHKPTLVDADDLRQEAWLIVDRLARRWDPAGGAFGAYVRATFPYELYRVLRTHSPARRSKHVHVASMPEEAWDLLLAHQIGADGREGDGQLAVAEMLETLDVDSRRVVALHALAGLSLDATAARLGMTPPQAVGRYHRAIAALTSRYGAPAITDDVRRLVAALYAAVERGRRLPGRAAMCRVTGLSEVRYADLMRLLVARGAIVGRSDRQTGRLAHATAEETLAALGATS